MFRINAAGPDGKPIVLGTADTATKALSNLQDALGDYSRAWVTDEQDLDVSLAELLRLADEEQQ